MIDLALLPAWWQPARSDPDRDAVWAECLRELTPAHPLHGRSTLLATSLGTDDILIEHAGGGDVVSAMHLSMAGRAEWPEHDGVEFTGGYAEFLAREQRRFG